MDRQVNYYRTLVGLGIAFGLLIGYIVGFIAGGIAADTVVRVPTCEELESYGYDGASSCVDQGGDILTPPVTMEN